MKRVAVGRLTVEIVNDTAIPVDARLTIAGPRVIEMSLTLFTGQRLFDEMVLIRQALLAARAVLQAPPSQAMQTEMTLLRLLNDLEILQGADDAPL